MLHFLPKRRRNLKLMVGLAGVFFLRLLLWHFSSSVHRSETDNDEGIDAVEYDILGRQRPPPKDDDPDRWRRYRPPVQSGVKGQLGKRFTIDKHYLSWSVDELDFVSLNMETVKEFVVATAASTSFYYYSMAAIATVQLHLPNHTIVFYDLDPHRKNSYVKTMTEVCNAKYRAFDYSRYPRHVQYLRNYAWKPLIIADLLTEYPGVLWIDSSIRFITSNFSTIFQKAVETDGMLALTSTGHSNFAVTHPQMYSFLPTSMEGMVQTDQHEANCVLLYRTRSAFENVVWWWTMCALDPLCIAPTNRTNCDSPYDSRSVYANCHRFDQSALNILLANYFAYDYLRYFGSQDAVKVIRNNRIPNARVHMCPEPLSKQNFTTVSKFRTS